MHQFTTPPATILDLGCGGGLWSIEAAKQWPVRMPTFKKAASHRGTQEAIVIGFDMKNIQPRSVALHEHANLADRVKWVHGNL
jgi:cyclopropane fatty-acyl-phospholipid synthase-like methyltransferase